MKILEKVSIKHRSIHKIVGDKIEKLTDVLAIEEPLEISISVLKAHPPIINKNISITMRTPGDDVDLALGFLFTEGIISSAKQVEDVHAMGNKVNVFLNTSKIIDLSKIARHSYTSSSCGVCGKASIDAIKTECKLSPKPFDLKINTHLIKGFPQKLREKQAVFDSTGGIHAAVLFDEDGEILALREDVGRHNALDKLIGASFTENRLPLNKQLLLLSGRASFELIQKASMAGIQCIMAVGAPSSLAVELAEEFGMTLIGFLNQKRYNIYCGENRITGL